MRPSLRLASQPLIRERRREEEQAERDEREHAVDRLELRQVEDEHLPDGDREQRQPRQPQAALVAEEPDDERQEPGGAPERAEQELGRLPGIRVLACGEWV